MRARDRHAQVDASAESEVYGKGMKIPFAEEDDVLLGTTDKARWAYAATKMIDWKPVRSLDEILDDVIRHEKSVAQAGA